MEYRRLSQNPSPTASYAPPDADDGRKSALSLTASTHNKFPSAGISEKGEEFEKHSGQ